jgi:hypothetical protein
VSYFIEIEEVYFVCTVWNFVRPCSLKIGIISRSIQDCSNYGFRTTYMSQIAKGNSGLYRILQEINQSLCAYHNINGKFVEEAKFQWKEDCEKGLDTLKKKLVTASILIFQDWKKEFHVHVDASSIALGTILYQPRGGRHRSPNWVCK